MPLLVVDTNVISLLIKLKGGHAKKDKAKAEWYLDRVRGNDLVRAFPTEGELLVWLEQTEPGARKETYERGVKEILSQTGLIDGTREVSRQWARITAMGRSQGRVHTHDTEHKNREAQLNDTWIAACALAHGLPLVSDNAKDFLWMVPALGLDLIHPPS